MTEEENKNTEICTAVARILNRKLSQKEIDIILETAGNNGLNSKKYKEENNNTLGGAKRFNKGKLRVKT